MLSTCSFLLIPPPILYQGRLFLSFRLLTIGYSCTKRDFDIDQIECSPLLNRLLCDSCSFSCRKSNRSPLPQKRKRLESELLLEEQERRLARAALVDAGGRVDELLLEETGEGLLRLLATIRSVHLRVGDQSLRLHVRGDGVTSGHHVRVVHVLHERLHALSLVDLLLAHALGDLQRRLLDAR